MCYLACHCYLCRDGCVKCRICFPCLYALSATASIIYSSLRLVYSKKLYYGKQCLVYSNYAMLTNAECQHATAVQTLLQVQSMLQVQYMNDKGRPYTWATFVIHDMATLTLILCVLCLKYHMYLSTSCLQINYHLSISI